MFIYAFLYCICAPSSTIQEGFVPVDFYDKEILSNLLNLTSYGVDILVNSRHKSTVNKNISYNYEIFSASYRNEQHILYNIVVFINYANCEGFNCQNEECSMKLLQKPCGNFNNLTEYQCSTKANFMFGGIKNIDLSNSKNLENLKNLSNFAVKTISNIRLKDHQENYDQELNKTFNYNFRIVTAKTQLVAGYLSYLNLRIHDAECIEKCPVKECVIKIWEKPWMNFKSITESNCFILPNVTYSIEWRQICPKDTMKLKSLDELIIKINKDSVSRYYKKLLQVDKSEKRVFKGNRYQFEFSIVETICLKNLKRINFNNCRVSKNATTNACSGSLIEKIANFKPYSNISVSCE